jgi:hypothetical protein
MSAVMNGPLTDTPAQKVVTRAAAPRFAAVSGQQRRFEEALQQAQSTPSFAARSGDTDRRSASWRRETIDTGRLRPQTSAARWDSKAFPLLTNGPGIVPSESLFPPLAPGNSSLGYAGGGQQNSALTVPLSRGLGSLSARFESGPDGIAAVGYDARGGTSYGTHRAITSFTLVGSSRDFTL